jgi:hypothetical protein
MKAFRAGATIARGNRPYLFVCLVGFTPSTRKTASTTTLLSRDPHLAPSSPAGAGRRGSAR